MIFYVSVSDLETRQCTAGSHPNPYDAIAEGLCVADIIMQRRGLPPIENLTRRDIADPKKLGIHMVVLAAGVVDWEQWWTMDDFRAYVERTKRRETAAQFFRRWNSEKHGGKI